MKKTIVELDLKGYSDIARELQDHFSVDLVMKLNDQIQTFVTDALKVAQVQPKDAIMATTGDGAILMFDTPSSAHIFAEAVHNATRQHNHEKTVALAKRWFRIGIATGELAIENVDGAKTMAGSVIARAVRLETASSIGEILADIETYDGLLSEQCTCYGAEEQIAGKRNEVFSARRYPVISGQLTCPTAARAAATSTLPFHSSTPNNLPRLQPFFGRAEELKQIREALDPENRTWGALIDGPGGMGKTSLAVRAAYDCPPDQFQRIIFLSVKDRELDDEGIRLFGVLILPGFLEMLNELARELEHPDITKAPEEKRIRLLLDVLRPTKSLLILDNLESLEKSDRDQVFNFVKRLPQGCKAILTSRRRIGSGSEELILEKLDEVAALATLADLARHNKLLAKTSEAERIALYNQTGGKPLLVRWLAGQLGRGSCRTLTDALRFLSNCPPDNDPLEFVFGDLVEEFTSDETCVLCALTYFTLPARVEHVAVVASLEDKIVETALQSLANRSLVVPDQEEESFALVPMVAEFLRHKRPEVVAETGIRLEKRAYSLIMANGDVMYDNFTNLDAVWPTIEPALPLFLSGSHDRLHDICSNLHTYLNFRGRWDERRVLCEKAEKVAIENGDERAAGWRAYGVAMVHYMRRETDALQHWAERVRMHWGGKGTSIREQAFLYRIEGLAHYLKAEYSDSIKCHTESIRLHKANSAGLNDIALSFTALANAQVKAHDYDQAKLNYEEGRSLAAKVNDDEGVANCLYKLAVLAVIENDWNKAKDLALDALPLAEKVGRQALIARDCEVLAKAFAQLGYREKGIPYARRAVEIYTRLGSPDLKFAYQTLRECE